MRVSSLLLIAGLVSTAAAKSRLESLIQYQLENVKQEIEVLKQGKEADVNHVPVIGIISQTLEKEMVNDTRFAGYNSYIMQSYVDWVEAAGARVVPLIVGESENVTLSKIQRLNGILFPGGDGDYLEYGRYVFKVVKELNDNGTYLPVWGTCMGYEYIVSYISDDGWDVLNVYDYETGSMALEFTVAPSETKMFNWLGNKAYLFENYNVTYNAHHWGMNPDKFNTDKGLKELFMLTSISYMPDGRPFVASIESEKYPFFGTQFHPEKATRIFREDLYVDHSWISIELNRHFADYFVYQSRKNTNSWGTYSETQKDIIQNYDLIVSDEWFDTVYVFN